MDEVYHEIRDYSRSWMNWVYGKLSWCYKCSGRSSEIMRLETGQYQCFPCVIKFNESGVLDKRYTFICLICGRYYYEFPSDGKNVAMLHCADCRAIQEIIKSAQI